MNRYPSYKVVLAGDAGVGKSCALHHALSGEDIQGRYIPTIGCSVVPLSFAIEGRHIDAVTLNVWDTAGNEKYGCLPDGYYAEANGVLIVSSQPQLYLNRANRMCPNAVVQIIDPQELNDNSFMEIARSLLQDYEPFRFTQRN